jgi:hypothetical protein
MWLAYSFRAAYRFEQFVCGFIDFRAGFDAEALTSLLNLISVMLGRRLIEIRGQARSA